MKKSIHNRFIAEGFDVVGFCKPTLQDFHRVGLSEFLEGGHHGTMDWMKNRAEQRGNPLALWPDAKSVIVIGHNYGPDKNPLDHLGEREKGLISCYAQNQDYHDVIKKKQKHLAQWLVREYGGEVKVFVDTAPVMEKPLAQMAGLGWQGKHTCLVSREFGSWLFLGAIFTTLEIDDDIPVENHCGSCTSCLDICPTNAFTAEGKLDARKCISYLTIEHKGHIPVEFRKAIGNRIYGCDDCLAVCPWNKFAVAAQEMAYQPRRELELPLLRELLALDDAAFRKHFTKSPIKRIGRDRFIRNVLIAVGNSGDVSLIEPTQILLADTSSLVRAMAVWTLSQLDPLAFYNMRSIYVANERDADVLAEWNCHPAAGRDPYHT